MLNSFVERIYELMASRALDKYRDKSGYSYNNVPLKVMNKLGIAPQEWAEHENEQDYSLSWFIDEDDETVTFYLD